jgi:hypothetical protein
MSDAWKKAERKVAKRLSAWACKDENALRRMPLQGRMMEEYLGDIIVNETASEDVRKDAAEFMKLVMIDVKRRVGATKTGWHFEQLLTAPKHQIIKWWNKLESAAKKYNKAALMILTKGDGRWFIILDHELYRKITYRLCNQEHSKVPQFLGIHLAKNDLVACEFQEFLEIVPATVLKETICPAAPAVKSINST